MRKLQPVYETPNAMQGMLWLSQPQSKRQKPSPMTIHKACFKQAVPSYAAPARRLLAQSHQTNPNMQLACGKLNIDPSLLSSARCLNTIPLQLNQQQ
jgi:hypothetical protein